jgi:hypothetical protein
LQKGRVWSLTAVERYFVDAMTEQGYDVHRAGWPDFYVVGADPTRSVGVEIKGPGDIVSEPQRAMHTALRAGGMRVEVVDLLSFRGFGISRRDEALIEKLRGVMGPGLRRSMTRPFADREST